MYPSPPETPNPYDAPKAESTDDVAEVVAPIQIAAHIDLRAYRRASQIYLQDAHVLLILRGAAVAAFLVVCAATYLDYRFGEISRIQCMINCGAQAVVLLVISLVLPSAVIWVAIIGTRTRSAPGVLGEHRILLTDDEITDSTDVYQHRWAWKAVSAVYARDDMLVIVTRYREFMVVPCEAEFGKHSFASARKYVTDHASGAGKGIG